MDLTPKTSATSERQSDPKSNNMRDISRFLMSPLLQEKEENLLQYRKGGYHPTCIGDEFNGGRYRIRLKLGWGGFSTVWLAFDRKEKRRVSLKIMVADTSKGSKELSNVSVISQRIQGRPGPWPLCRTLDHFVHNGPNGEHMCLVQELVGPSLRTVLSYKDYDERSREFLRPETVLKITSQLLQAVAQLHSVGISHGDLSLGNVVFALPALGQMTEKKLLDEVGEFEREPVKLIAGHPPPGPAMPRELIESAPWDGFIDEDEADIKLIDFGESFFQEIDSRHLSQPVHHHAPETIFEPRVDQRADLWRAGMIIYSLVFSKSLFFTLEGRVGLVSQMIEYIGEGLPNRWRQSWLQLQKDTSVKANVRAGHSKYKSRLEAEFHTILPDKRLRCLYPVIKGLMRFLPSDRMSARQALSILEGGT